VLKKISMYMRILLLSVCLYVLRWPSLFCTSVQLLYVHSRSDVIERRKGRLKWEGLY
jgi:hypothetical protein